MLVVLRISVSLYEIPSTALTPELAPDYHERTDLLSFRWFFGIAGAVGLGASLGLVFVRQDAAHPKGMLDPVGYGHFGLFAAIVTFLAIMISSATTHRYIPILKAPPVRKLTSAQSFREIAATLSNPSLVVVIVSGLISGVAGGITSTLSPYMNLHFWMLKPQVMGGMALIASPLVAGGHRAGAAALAPAGQEADHDHGLLSLHFHGDRPGRPAAAGPDAAQWFHLGADHPGCSTCSSRAPWR